MRGYVGFDEQMWLIVSSLAVRAGVVDCQSGTGSVELRRYPNSHPFAQLQGSDNIIAFTTQRYKNQPLIVRYPAFHLLCPCCCCCLQLLHHVQTLGLLV